MKKKYGFVFGMLFVILVASIGLTTLYVNQTNKQSQQDELVIVTSFYPMYIATLNIVGETKGVNLQSLSEPQTGCLHDFQLTPEDMKLLSQADIFVINGGGMEIFMEEIASNYPDLKIIDASSELELIVCESEHEHDHEHGHAHEENGHAWMGIETYRQQVQFIAEALGQLEYEYAKDFRHNAHEYDEKLAKLQEEQEKLAKKTQGTNVIIFHEAFMYIAEEYHLSVVYEMNLDGERQVSAGEVADVIDAIEKNNVSYILAEEEYGRELATTIQKEKDVTVIYLDALNHGEYDADSYIKGMQENIKLLEGVQ